MKVITDHIEGRDSYENVGSVTVIGLGIYTSGAQVAEFCLHNGQLAMKDMRGRLLGSLSVEP